MLKLYNTQSRKIEEFTPLNPPQVAMYACGPTVYDYTHIGHLKKYIGDDILKRVLKANGYEVKHVMNITDVGHLSSDADAGEDKLEKGASERGQTVWEVAKYFEEYFFKTVDEVNIIRSSIVCRATEHISEQIKLTKQLEDNGFIYQTTDALYFDTSKLPDYGKLTGQKLEEKQTGAREDVVTDANKKNPADFALWFFTVGRFESHAMKWSSPWGEGFPGWHIECSAMSMEYLGQTLDIHTGGIDHIPVHHTNEIAQSEAATNHQFVRFWVHHNFLNINSDKMSKSKKNFFRLEDVKAKEIEPLALRYLFLTGHYRDELSFTWESLQGAQNALNNLKETVSDWDEPAVTGIYPSASPQDDSYSKRFLDALNNDLNTPQALAVLHEMVKSDLDSAVKSALILQMDEILGLGLDEFVAKKIEIPREVQVLLEAREEARANQDFAKSDEIRKQIKDLGFEVLDTQAGPKVKMIS